MKHAHPFIVLTPGMRTNTTEKHLVVRVEEWLAVTLGKQATYAFAHEHPDYMHAAADRDDLNHRPGISLVKPLKVLQGSDA